MADNVLDIFIAQKTSQGWEVINRTGTSVQMRKPKQWNRAAIVIGLLTAVLGFGFLILLIATLDYIFKHDQIAFVTIDQIRSNKLPRAFLERSQESNRTMQIVAIIIVIGLILAFLLYWGFTTFGY